MTSSKGAVALGALSVLAIPVGVVLARELQSLRLLETLYVAVPVSVVLGLAAIAMLRRARYAAARSIHEAGSLRLATLLAWGGAYLGVTGALALAVYGILRYAQG